MQVGKYEIDAQRTVELSLSGTLVESGKGDPDHFFCVPLSVVSQTVCPRCGCSNLRNQGSIQRSYLDVIPRGDDAAVITVTIEFRKNKCMNPDCNCVFYPEIPFAGRYSRTTHRLENAIVRMVIRGCLSFTESAIVAETRGSWDLMVMEMTSVFLSTLHSMLFSIFFNIPNSVFDNRYGFSSSVCVFLFFCSSFLKSLANALNG